MTRMPLTLLSLMVLALSACSSMHTAKSPANTAPALNAESQMPPVVLPAKVSAVGYGALPTQEGLSPAQRRLLAIRAAKLDAYRALAETVAGIKINGTSTVSGLALNSDSFRVYVEAYLRGARVLSVTPLPDGAYETVLELTLGGEFYRAAATEPAPAGNNVGQSEAMPAQPEPVKAVPQPAAVTRMEGSSNFYLAL